MAATELPAHTFLLPCLTVLHVPHAAMLTMHCHFPIGSQPTTTFCMSDTHFIHSAACVKVMVMIETAVCPRHCSSFTSWYGIAYWESSNLLLHCCENLKFHMMGLYCVLK